MGEFDLADHPVEAALGEPELLGRGIYRFERYRVVLPERAGQALTRDVVRVGRVVVIVPVDLDRDEIVLLRQFRLGAHLALGTGDMVEVPAGRAEAGEELIEAARRECLEEIGVAPAKLVPLFSLLPSPGMSDEHMSFFLATVDASKVAARAGAADEHEETRPMRVPVDRALAALAAGTLHYGAAVIALQWLALNRSRLTDIVRSSSAAHL
jgi:ADP-ribose pyrophosphatase